MRNLKRLYSAYQEFYRKFYGMERELASFRDPIKQIIRTKNLIPDVSSAILEYGCASGFNLEYLKSQGFTNLYGIEQNSDIYSHRDISKEIKISNENFINLEYSKLIGIEKFDFIFTRSVLQQKEGIGKIKGDINSDSDVLRILKIFRMILNDNGIIVLNEGSSTRNWYELFSNSGFLIVDEDVNFFKLKKNIS